MTRLGCQVSWSREKGLRLRHPKRGQLRTSLKDGCPQVDEEVRRLVREFEADQLKRVYGQPASTKVIVDVQT